MIDIEIHNVNCIAKGVAAYPVISSCLMSMSPGFQYTYLYKRGRWDGKVNLFNGEAFPTGLLHEVIGKIMEYKIPYNITDCRVIRHLQLENSSVVLRPYQEDVVNAALFNVFGGTWWPRGVIQAATGCVDKDTEFLSPSGWKKISEYNGEEILQYNPDKTAEYVTPISYIKNPCTKFNHIKTKYGLDMCLSDEHDMIYFSTKTSSRLLKKSVDEIKEIHNKNNYGFKGYIPTVCNLLTKQSLPLSDNELRLQIAVIADGYFDKKSSTNRVVIRIKKTRKIIRLEQLLLACNITYKKIICKTTNYTKFSFNAPIRIKVFDTHFYGCSIEQLQIIVKECLLWDGDQVSRFFSTIEESADFIQYAATMTGINASISICPRIKQYKNKERKHTEFNVNFSKKNRTSFQKGSGIKPVIGSYTSLDGFKYCFTVPSGMIVLRRNKHIFITGNSGKTEMAADIILKCNIPTLFLVHRQDLQTQTIERFLPYGIDVGTLDTIGQQLVTVATIQSLMSWNMEFAKNYTTSEGEDIERSDDWLQEKGSKQKVKGDEIKKALLKVDQVFIDEAHLIAAKAENMNMFSHALQLMPNAFMRWGLTATPFMRDKLHNWMLEGATGPSIAKITNRELIDLGYLSEAFVDVYVMKKNGDLPTDWPRCYDYGIITHRERNAQIVKCFATYPGPTLILVNNIGHGDLLEEALNDAGFRIPFVSGTSSKTDRKHAIEKLKSGRLKGVIASTIWDEGIDISNLGTVILAGGGKSEIKNLQRLGRGLRRAEGKPNLQLVDFLDSSPPILKKHSTIRHKIWTDQGFTINFKK